MIIRNNSSNFVYQKLINRNMKNIKLSLLISAALFSGTFMYGQAKEASVMIDKAV